MEGRMSSGGRPLPLCKGRLWRVGGPGPATRASGLGVGPALELGAGRGRRSGQAQAAEARPPVPPPKRHVGALVPRPQRRPGRQESAGSGPKGPRSGALAPSGLPQWPRAPAPRAHGVKSLPASLCSKLFSKRGREWFSCYQHGFWALGNALLFSRAPQRDLLFPSLPLALALPRAPHPPTPSCLRLPPRAAPPGPPGRTEAWPRRPPSRGALPAGAGPGDPAAMLRAARWPWGGHAGRRGAQCEGPWRPPGLQGRGPATPQPRASFLRRNKPPSRPPCRCIRTAACGGRRDGPIFRRWRLRLGG